MSRHQCKRVRVELDIPEDRITDLIEGHEPIYSSWLHEMSWHWHDGTLFLNYDVEEEEEGNATGKKKFTREQVIAAFINMAMESPGAFADWLNETDDALTFDCILQYIVFGKLVYA